MHVVDCANSSRQFGDQLSGFGRQSEKFSHIGARIRRNLTPCEGSRTGTTGALGGEFEALGVERKASASGDI